MKFKREIIIEVVLKAGVWGLLSLDDLHFNLSLHGAQNGLLDIIIIIEVSLDEAS